MAASTTNACLNQIGVKNLMIEFVDCDAPNPGGIGNVKATAHCLHQDSLPEIDSVPYRLEELSCGRVRRTWKNATIRINVVRDLRIPLAYYQGRAGLNVQIEYINGDVFTGLAGNVTQPEPSDTSSVQFTVAFEQITEVLPPTAASLS